MNNTVIYRRYGISIAYTDGQTYSGSNFSVWYGYSNSRIDCHDMIIDAGIIKQDMKADLSSFDHTCLTVSDSQNIWHVMSEIGNMIFQNAIQNRRILLAEIIIENCYGDYVTIDSRGITITNMFLRDKNSNEVFFLADNVSRINLLGREISLAAVAYKMSISRKELHNILTEKKYLTQIPNQPWICVSSIDLATNIITSTVLGSNTGQYHTITCVEHFAHQLPISNRKCNHLHGHSYSCRVTVRVRTDEENRLVKLDGTVRRLLKNAFAGECEVSTCENVVDFLSESLCSSYEVLWIELKETDNIKVIRRFNFAD